MKTSLRAAGRVVRLADVAVERAEQATDRVDVFRHRIEIAHDQVSGAAWRGRGVSCRRVAAGRRAALAHLLQRSRLAKSWTNVVGG